VGAGLRDGGAGDRDDPWAGGDDGVALQGPLVDDEGEAGGGQEVRAVGDDEVQVGGGGVAAVAELG